MSAKAKGILQQRADLKDSSRLKLIEIPFVAFGVFYVISLSLSLSLVPFLFSLCEQGLTTNK